MMQEITSTRANPLVDPTLGVWHGEVALYLFLGGLVAGIMVITGFWMLRAPERPRSRSFSLLPWAAPILLSLGMLFLWLDLENRWNGLRFYLAFRITSPMSWGAWILLAIYPASVLLAWVMTPEDLREAFLRRAAGGGLRRFGGSTVRRLGTTPQRTAQPPNRPTAVHVRRIALANVILGVALGIYTGVLLGALAARPLWNSAVLGPLFLTSGLSTGAAFLLLWRLSEDERRLLGRADAWLILAELGLLAAWLGDLAAGAGASRAAAGMFVGGPYTAAFWTMVVTLGLLTPLAGEWIEHRRHVAPGRVAPVLVLLGGLALRWIIVYAGQAVASARMAGG